MAYTPSSATNTNARLTIAHRLLALALMLLSLEAASMYMALRLGMPFAVRQPLAWLGWMVDPATGPHLTARLVYTTVGIVSVGSVAAIVAGWWLGYRRSLVKQDSSGIHGTAHFATPSEIKASGLLPASPGDAQGVICGGVEVDGVMHLLRHDGPEHIRVAAPTRSGKGVSVMVPTALTWARSLLVNDVKLEVFMLTSGFRHRAGQLVMCFEPTATPEVVPLCGRAATSTVKWNPIEEIRTGTPHDVKDAQNLAALIADPDGKGMDDHWVATSYELLVGMLLHIAYGGGDARSLPAVSRKLGDPSFSDIRQLFSVMKQYKHDPDFRFGWTDTSNPPCPTATHPAVLDMAVKMLNKEDKELSGVVSTAVTKLSLYTDPIVAANVERSDFSVRDLMHHERPVSFYFAIRPSDKQRLRPLVRLFFQFVLARHCEVMEFEQGRAVRSYRHRLLFAMDELPTLKKLDLLQDALGYMAGFGIKALLIYQDDPQLFDAYGEHESIRSGCHVAICFAPNTERTAEEISNMCGVTTAPRQTVSYSGRRNSPTLSEMNVSEELVERPLLTKDEVRALPPDDMLIFVSGHPVIRGKKAPYYKNPVLVERATKEPPTKFTAEDRGTGETYWMMAAFDRDAVGGVLSIRVYSRFPTCRVRGVVLRVNGLLERITATLEGEAASGRNGYWEVEHDQMRLRFSAPVGVESLALWLEPVDGNYEVSGCLTSRGTAEREAVELGWKLAGRDAYFERFGDGDAVRGRVLGGNEFYLVVGEDRREQERFSVHLRSSLSRVPTIGERVVIQYQQGKGKVS